MINSTQKYTSWNLKVAPKYKGCRHRMSPQTRMDQGRQFKALYASLGFNVCEVAQLLHVSTRTVHNWISGAVPVPFMAVKLLRLMLRYELPGKAFEGWTLSAGKLYTPEGFELAPHEVSWWSLLVRQARLFRSMYQDKFTAKGRPVGEPAIAPAGPSFRNVYVTRSEILTGETTPTMCNEGRGVLVTPSGSADFGNERRRKDLRATFRQCPSYSFALTSMVQKGGAR